MKLIFLGTSHGDHVDGLFGLIGIACWYYTDMRFDVFLPEQKGIDAVTAFLEATLGDPSLFPKYPLGISKPLITRFPEFTFEIPPLFRASF